MSANQGCDKIELAGTSGFRVMYCPACQVVELEIGALSLRLAPDIVQRFANVMMKASLKLDRVVEQEYADTRVAGTVH